MIECPECGGKIPETEKECPICGCILDVYTLQSPAAPAVPETMPAFTEVVPVQPKRSFSGTLFRWFRGFFLFLFVCFALLLTVLMTDFMGARTELRRLCMTDSGTGSEADPQLLRVTVKHYLLIGLDLIDNGGSATYIEIDRCEREPEKTGVRRRTKREPIEIPPDPPEVETFQDNSKE